MEWIVLDGSLTDRQVDNLTTLLSDDGVYLCVLCVLLLV